MKIFGLLIASLCVVLPGLNFAQNEGSDATRVMSLVTGYSLGSVQK